MKIPCCDTVNSCDTISVYGSLPGAVAGQAYSYQLLILGVTKPYHVSLVAGPLPSGLSLSDQGLLSGMPSGHFNGTFSIAIVDADRCRQVIELSMIVLAPPDAPVAQDADVYFERFIANWDEVVNADNYFLDVSEAVDFSSFVPGYNNLNVGNVLTYNVTGLDEGTTYYYRVRAHNVIATSSNSNVISLITGAAPVVQNASDITFESFTANWNGVSIADSYRLDVSLESDFSSFVTGYNDLLVSGTSQPVIDLAAGTQYYYRVRAAKGSEASSNSAIEDPMTAEISDLQLLLTDEGITLVSGDVDTWADQSGNARDAFAPTASNRPGFANQINGITVPTFGGAPEYLEVPYTNPLNQPFTWFMVVQYSALGDYALFSTVGGAGIQGDFIRIRSDGGIRLFTGDNQYNADSVFAASGTYIICVESSAVTGTPGVARVLVNNVEVINVAAPRSSVVSHNLLIGTVNDTGVINNLVGEFGGATIFNRVLSAAELTAEHKKYSIKWGVTI